MQPTPPSRFPVRQRRAATACAAGAAVLVLAACGGAGDAPAPVAVGPASAGAHEVAALVVPPVLDDGGRPAAALPSAVPADAAARTRLGLYATPAQVAQLREQLKGGVIEVDVPAVDDGRAVFETVAVAWGLQASADHPSDVPVFVSGANVRATAAVVDRLADGGLTRVWLVHGR